MSALAAHLRIQPKTVSISQPTLKRRLAVCTVLVTLVIGAGIGIWFYWTATHPTSSTNHVGAGLAVKQQSPQDAIWHFTQAVKEVPGYDLPYALRGEVWHALGDDSAAMKDLDHAVELYGSCEALARNARGIVLRDLGDYRLALEDHNRAIELAPEFAAAYAQRAGDWLYLKEDASAINDYRRAVELQPNYDMAHIGLASILANCRDAQLRDGEEAVVHARRACELTDYRSPGHLEILADAYITACKPEQADKIRAEAKRLLQQTNSGR